MSRNSVIQQPFMLYKGLPRDIFFIFIARIVSSVGHFVFPFMTLVLTDKMGLSAKETGTFMLMTTFAFIPGSLLGGKLSDTIGRKAIILFCQFLSASFFLSCGFIGISPVLPYLIIGAQFFMGASFPAMQALTMDITTRKNRQAAFSLLYLGHNIGLAFGPLIAGFLYNSFFRLLFWGDALTTYLSLILIVFFVRESIHETKKDTGETDEPEMEKAESGNVFQVLMRRPYLLVFVFFALILNIVYAQYLFSLPMYLKELFQTNGARYYGIIMTTNAVVVITCTTIAVSLTKKFRAVVNLCFVAVLYATGFGMLFFAHHLAIFFVSTFIWTIGEILAMTNKSVFIANHTPKSHRGRVNAILPIVASIGFAFSPYFIGMFIDHYSIRMVWPIMFGLSIIGLAGFASLYLYVKRGKTEG